MLRVDIRDSANALSLKLEGRFTGNDAENTRTLMARCHDGMTLIVDLTEVTFIDSVGEEVLSFFGRFGAEFVAQTSYTLDICERLHLRLARDGASDTNTSGASRTNGRRRRAYARQSDNEKVSKRL
jgi:hypothetical protein